MSQSPVYRKVPGTVDTFEVKPLDEFAACALVEKIEGTAFLRLYVSKSKSGATATATYKAKSTTSYWLVDIPNANTVNLGQILDAIVKGDPGLPDPPVSWKPVPTT